MWWNILICIIFLLFVCSFVRLSSFIVPGSLPECLVPRQRGLINGLFIWDTRSLYLQTFVVFLVTHPFRWFDKVENVYNLALSKNKYIWNFSLDLRIMNGKFLKFENEKNIKIKVVVIYFGFYIDFLSPLHSQIAHQPLIHRHPHTPAITFFNVISLKKRKKKREN